MERVSTRGNRIFSCGVEELTLPLVHVRAPTKGWAPLHHEEQVITKNAPTPSLERRASHRVQVFFLWLPQTPRAHQEPPITKIV